MARSSTFCESTPVVDLSILSRKWSLPPSIMKPCTKFSFLLFFHSLNANFRPDPSLLDPNEFVAPRNSFAMSFRDFIPHLMNVLDQLGMSVHARTDFIK